MLIRFDRGRWKCHSTVAHSPGSRCHHRSSHQSRWSRQPADQNMLFPHSSASLDSPISDYRRLPCPSPCNGFISTRLLQRTPRRCSEVSSRTAVWCHEGCRTPHPRASSEKAHDWRDLHEIALARHSRTNRLQVLCACFSVSARVCTSLSGGLFYPGWCSWGTVESTISGYRPVAGSAHQDCDNRPAGIRSLFSDCLEQSLSGSSWS